MYVYICVGCLIITPPKRIADQMVQWLGKPAAVPEVPGSNPWEGMDVELSVLGSTSSCAQKTGRREVPGSIPGRACRPSRSKFSVVFSETRVNAG